MVNDIRYGVTYDKDYPRYAKKSPRKSSGGVYHNLKKGENLYRVAKAYDVNQRELMRVNRISDPTEIPIGKSLWIPGARFVKKVSIAPQRTSYAKKQKTSGKIKQKQTYVPYFPNKGYIWPVEGGVITSKYGTRSNKKHDGLDIGAPTGRKIFTVQSGIVLFSGYGPTGYGKLVIVKHNKRVLSVYAHCSKILVRKGQRVTKGQVIAKVGSTGRSTGPHLHFEVRVDRKPQNPLKYIPNQPSTRRYAKK